MSYQLSIEVYGLGTDPTARSHWAFMIHRPPNPIGDLFHVRVIDLPKLWFQFEHRRGASITDMQPLGMCQIGHLTPQQRRDAIKVISDEPPPRDGKKRCQDWVFDTLISLEAEGLVQPGTSVFWEGMVGKPAAEVKQACGDNWTGFTGLSQAMQ